MFFINIVVDTALINMLAVFLLRFCFLHIYVCVCMCVCVYQSEGLFACLKSMFSLFAQIRYKIQCCGREKEDLIHTFYHRTARRGNEKMKIIHFLLMSAELI